MPKKIWIPALVLTLLLGTILFTTYIINLPNNIPVLDTIVLGQTRYVPGSSAAIRVLVRDYSSSDPLGNAEVSLSIQDGATGQEIPLFEGRTDSDGIAEISFTVPDEGLLEPSLIIHTDSSLGEDTIEQPIQIERDYRLLLSTDKPIYQPGQLIHIRAVALSTFDLVPAANQSVEFVIADGKGNKVFRETADTSDFGFASLDFQLASEVNTGDYKITAVMGNTSSEITIPVERYVLPKFDFSWTTDRNFYRPGETVAGIIQADYFFGKPVDESELTLTAYTFDFERIDFFTTSGTTGSDGSFAFEIRLPDYITGSDLDAGLGRVYIQADLTDQADHSESSSFSLPVSQQDIVIKAVPESGQVKQNLENIFYIFTSYPDGTPAETGIDITDYYTGETLNTIATSEYGLAEVRITPPENYMNFRIDARDQLGAAGSSEFYFEGSWEEETILLRPDNAVYRVGDSMVLDLFSTAPGGRAYLDIIREGQTISTRTVTLEDGRGQAVIDLSAEMFGTLELHAYKILSSGRIVRDTRMVVVDSPRDLVIHITPDRDVYLPGDTAAIDFNITNPQGGGTQAALGLSIVDEAVFALAEQDPGFARLYFLLEAEILQPRYEIHGLSIPVLLQEDSYSQDQVLLAAVEGAATASLAETSADDPFTLHRSTYVARVEAVSTRQMQLAGVLGNSLLVLFAGTALVILGLTVHTLLRTKLLVKSLLILAGIFSAILLAVMVFPMPDWAGRSPFSRLGYVVEEMFYRAELFALLLLIGGLVGFIALFVYAFKYKDRPLQFSQISLVLLPFLIAALSILGNTVYIDYAYNLLEITVIIILAIPLAYLLRSMAFALLRKPWWAAASFGAPLVLVFFLYAGASISMSAALPMARNGGDFLVEEEGVFAEPMMEMAAGAPAMDMAMDDAAKASGEAASSQPRLRQYFPETMYWNPEVVTDPAGNLSLDIPIADSITTWRMTAFAASADGQLGTATAGIRVFQDFFIDLDLPLALTQNDEISIPVGIFNYLEDEQTVRLVFETDPGIELLDNPETQLVIPANDIQVQYFRVRAADFGRFNLRVTAYGSQMSDAVQKAVTVYPDGKQFFFSSSDMLPADGLTETVDLPQGILPGTQQLMVKIYPGVVSQVVEGLDSILQMPNGCFEQTSSTTYPNILVLDYLETTDQVSPEVQMKAEEYINLGYQRLTTFEVPGGGFSLFGDDPADIMLSAYAVQEFSDMNRVHPVDEALISRTAEWLLNQQQPNGSWQNPESFHESTLTAQTDPLPVTSYVTWSLAVAGYQQDSRTQNAVAYLKEHVGQSDDPYVLGLAVNALVAAQADRTQPDSATLALLDRLAAMAMVDGDSAWWQSETATFMGSEGDIANLEATAMITYAMIRSNTHSDLVNKALTYIIRGKDSFGNWHSTQATMLSLKVLIESVRSGMENSQADITVSLNDGQRRTVQITPENFDIVQQITFDDVLPGPGNRVSIEMAGEGKFLYQIHGSYYLPWSEVPQLEMQQEELITVDVSYDRTSLQVDDMVEVSVDVSLNTEGTAEWAIIDLGIPPGFSVAGEDLNSLIIRYGDTPVDYEWPVIEKFEMTGRQIIVYISNLSYGKPMQFSYHMQARYPLTAQAPASSAYDYYNPDVNGEQAPVVLTVTGE